MTPSIKASRPATGDSGIQRMLSTYPQPPSVPAIAPVFAPDVPGTSTAVFPPGTSAPAKSLRKPQSKLAIEAMFLAAVAGSIRQHIADCWRYRKL
ncbi:MAG TPA: hypothetical protein VGD64_08605, partial [Acidisarcina sp.]